MPRLLLSLQFTFGTYTSPVLYARSSPSDTSLAPFVEIHSLLVLLTVLTGIVFGMATRKCFLKTDTSSAWKSALILCFGLILLRALYCNMTRTPSVWLAAGGAAFCLGGLGLFFWSIVQHGTQKPGVAFTSVAPDQIVTSGPYQFVRHPIYSSYLLSVTGLTLGAWDVILLAGLAVMFGMYWSAASKEERLILSSHNRETYLEYMKSTGRLTPRLVSLGRAPQV